MPNAVRVPYDLSCDNASSAIFFFFALPGLPCKSSKFKLSPYLRSRVNKVSVSGNKLKSRTRDNLVSLRISANYYKILYISSGTLERR